MRTFAKVSLYSISTGYTCAHSTHIWRSSADGDQPQKLRRTGRACLQIRQRYVILTEAYSILIVLLESVERESNVARNCRRLQVPRPLANVVDS